MAVAMIRLPIAPKQRPDPQRYQTWGGRVGNRNPDAYAAWLEHAVLLIRSLWKSSNVADCPVALVAVFVLAPPKKEAAKLAGLPCARRPDLDRYCHALMDAVTQAGTVWEDDNQVARLEATKRYAFEGEGPCIHFAVEPVA